MRVGIDARFLTHPQAGGFKSYTQNLIAALAVVDHENEYVLYVDRPAGDSFPATDGNFETCVVAGSTPVLGMPWREQVGLPQYLRRHPVDVLHSPSLTGPLFSPCPLVVTIHDVIWLFPERFSSRHAWSMKRQFMESYYRWVPWYVARSASAVITVSQAAKRDIVKALGLDAASVFVTLEAASPRFRRLNIEAIESVRKDLKLAPDFILAVGSADPRKNIGTLLIAYSRLAPNLRARYQLVVIWTHSLLAGEVMRQVDTLGLTGRVLFLQRISDDDLVAVYNAAALFVFPSLYEGFGLPPLEAMACGTPVVASNNSSIPEVVGDAALLFDAQDPASIADAITRSLTDEAVRAEQTANGLKRSSMFSWTECARKTVFAYRYAVERHPPIT